MIIIVVFSLLTVNSQWFTLDGNPAQLIGHRGYSAFQPEHTLGSYWLASVSNSDYVEPDLVLTKDLIPVCHHNVFIRDTTDILDHPEFLNKQRNYTGILDRVYKTVYNEFFICDFTLEELRTLRVKQKQVGIKSKLYDKVFSIPTFQEFLDTVNLVGYQLGRGVNIAPELKESDYHRQLFLDNPFYFEDEVLRILNYNGYPLRHHQASVCLVSKISGTVPCGEVILQNFNLKSLQYLKTQLNSSKVELMILNSDTPYYFTYQGLHELSNHIQWYGLAKQYLFHDITTELKLRNIDYNTTSIYEAGGFINNLNLTDYAHSLALKVCIYTIYDKYEPNQIPTLNTTLNDEVNHYFKLGIDGLFVENINQVYELVNWYQANYGKGLNFESYFYKTVFVLISSIIWYMFN